MREPSWELEFVENAARNALCIEDRKRMKRLAAEGWEPFAVTAGVAYFKRLVQHRSVENKISKAVDIGPIRVNVSEDKPYWCRAPWTDSFVGFNSIEEAHEYASDSEAKNGPVYILELVYRYRVNSADRLR